MIAIAVEVVVAGVTLLPTATAICTVYTVETSNENGFNENVLASRDVLMSSPI